MSKLKDKVLKIVVVIRYALLRALFSFAKMPNLIFYSQLFQQSYGCKKRWSAVSTTFGLAAEIM